MSFAIVQKHLRILDGIKYAPVYKNALNLVELDAVMRIHNVPCGVLLRDLTEEKAKAVQDGFLEKGIEVHILETEKLGTVRKIAEKINKAAILDDGIEIEDMYGRKKVFEWLNIYVISAVRHTITEQTVAFARTHMQIVSQPQQGSQSIETQDNAVLMDIFTDEGRHFRINHHRFNYSYLGDRIEHTTPKNFSMMVGDILTNADESCYLGGNLALIGEGDFSHVTDKVDLNEWFMENEWRYQVRLNGLEAYEGD